MDLMSPMKDLTVLGSLVVGGATVGFWLGTRRIHSQTIAVAGQDQDTDAQGAESDGALDSIKPRAMEESKLVCQVI